jgi:hypothetical protein
VQPAVRRLSSDDGTAQLRHWREQSAKPSSWRPGKWMPWTTVRPSRINATILAVRNCIGLEAPPKTGPLSLGGRARHPNISSASFQVLEDPPNPAGSCLVRSEGMSFTCGCGFSGGRARATGTCPPPRASRGQGPDRAALGRCSERVGPGAAAWRGIWNSRTGQFPWLGVISAKAAPCPFPQPLSAGSPQQGARATGGDTGTLDHNRSRARR